MPIQFFGTKLFPDSRRLRVAWLLALAAGFGAAGCTQVLVGPETRGEYKLGELQVMADAGFVRSYEAVKRGMKDAGLFQTGDDRKVIEAEVNGRDALDTRVIVKVKEVGPNRTSIKIRYGLKGDLASAQKLYEAIRKHL
jgi:hypothetical protein